MNYFEHDYIVSGDIFADESVLCMRCAAKILGLSYREMPKVNSPREKVNVVCKMKYGNYRQVPVVLYRQGQQSIANLLLCDPCVKEVVPELNSDAIIKQMKRAFQIEARWAGLPEEAIEAINRKYADGRILRKLNAEEIMENKILEGVA